MRRLPSGGPGEPLTRRRTPPSGSTRVSSPGAPGPGTAAPERGSTSTRAAPCARTPGRPHCTGGGCALGGTFSGAFRAEGWPSWGRLRTGNRDAYGNAGSCRRRPQTTAPPAPRRRRIAANQGSASSLGRTSSTLTPRRCAPGTPSLGGRRAHSGLETMSRSKRPGPCPARSRLCTEPSSMLSS